MKKCLVLGILGLSLSALPSFGQGIIALDNYLSSGANGDPRVRYLSAGIPANGVSGVQGTPGAGLVAGWTIGFYWAPGDQLANIIPDPTTQGIPSGGGLTLATGSGSTTPSFVFGLPGTFAATAAFQTPGVAANGTITMELIVYNTASGSYANANYRGHSDPFTMTVADPTGAPSRVGDFMPSFGVYLIPEPSTFALAALSAACMLFHRKRKMPEHPTVQSTTLNKTE